MPGRRCSAAAGAGLLRRPAGGLERGVPLGASVAPSGRGTRPWCRGPGRCENALQAEARPAQRPTEETPQGRGRSRGLRVTGPPTPQTPAEQTAHGSGRSRACRPPSGPCASPSAGSSSPSRSRTPSTRWPSGRPRPRRARGRAAQARCCRTANAVSPCRGRSHAGSVLPSTRGLGDRRIRTGQEHSLPEGGVMALAVMASHKEHPLAPGPGRGSHSVEVRASDPHHNAEEGRDRRARASKAAVEGCEGHGDPLCGERLPTGVAWEPRAGRARCT